MLALKHHHAKKKHPHKKSSQWLDFLIYIAAFAGPIMTIPQIYDIWSKRDLAVNLLTWISYVVIAGVWLYYGIVHKSKPIIFSNILWIVAESLVVVGAVLYR